MPKEKNSADLAISPAIIAARGTSIIVPIMVCTWTPVSSSTSASTFAVASRAISISCTDAVSGIMTSGFGSLPAFFSSAAACAIARTCMSQQPGDDQDEPDAAQAEHGVLLVQPAHRVQQLAVLLGGLVPGQGDLDRQVGEVGQELVQRRVDQPDGDRQAVHRLEDLHEVAALQRLERVQRGLPARLVLGQDEPLDQLAALAEEHVLGADQADPARRRTGGPGRSPRRCPRWRARRGGGARRRAS